jgi:hypothetical protein
MMSKFCKTCGYIDPGPCGSVECDVLEMPAAEAERRQAAGEFWCARNPKCVGREWVDPRGEKDE